MILSGGGRGVVGAAGGHLVINLPVLPHPVLREVLQEQYIKKNAAYFRDGR